MKKIFSILLTAMLMPLLAFAQDDYNRSLTFGDYSKVSSPQDRLDVDHTVLPGITSQTAMGGKSITVGAWVRLSDYTSSNFGSVIISYGGLNHNNDNGLFTLIADKEGALKLAGFGITGRLDFKTAQALDIVLSKNTWYYIAIAVDFDNHQIRAYLDGELAKTLNFSETISTFGSFDDAPYGFGFGGLCYLGAIDDIHIVDRAITEADAQLLYNDRAAKVDGLVGWYTLDEVKDGTTSHFENKAPNSESASVDAVYYRTTGTAWENGLIDVNKTEVQPDLSTINAETQRPVNVVVENPALTFITNVNSTYSPEDRVDIDHGILGVTKQEDCSTKSVSFGAWIRMTQIANYGNYSEKGNCIFQYGGLNHSNANGLLVLKANPTTGNLEIGGFGVSDNGRLGITDRTTTQKVGLNEWHYVAVAVDFDTREIRIYYDGERIKTITIPANKSFGTFADTPWGIGFGGVTFNGSMDDIHIVDAAISDEDAMLLFTDRAEKVNGLVGWYTFDEVKKGTTSHFENKVAAKADYDAVYYKITGTSNGGDGGIINVSRAQTEPNLSGLEIEEQREINAPEEEVDLTSVEGRWAFSVVDCSDGKYNTNGAQTTVYFKAKLEDDTTLTFTSESNPSYVAKATYNAKDNTITFVKNPLGQEEDYYLQGQTFVIFSETVIDPQTVRGTYNPENGKLENFKMLLLGTTPTDISVGWILGWYKYSDSAYSKRVGPKLAYIIKGMEKASGADYTFEMSDVELTHSPAVNPTQSTVSAKVTKGRTITKAEVTYTLNDGSPVAMTYDKASDRYSAEIKYNELKPGIYTVTVTATAYVGQEVYGEPLVETAGKFDIPDTSLYVGESELVVEDTQATLYVRDVRAGHTVEKVVLEYTLDYGDTYTEMTYDEDEDEYYAVIKFAGLEPGEYEVDYLASAYVGDEVVSQVDQYVADFTVPDNSLSIGSASVVRDEESEPLVAVVTVKDVVPGANIKNAEISVRFRLDQEEYSEPVYSDKDGAYVAEILLSTLEVGEHEVFVKAFAAIDGKTVSESEEVSAGKFSVKESDGIADITVDIANGVRFFNLQGVEIENPANGLYIRVEGENASKVYVK